MAKYDIGSDFLEPEFDKAQEIETDIRTGSYNLNDMSDDEFNNRLLFVKKIFTYPEKYLYNEKTKKVELSNRDIEELIVIYDSVWDEVRAVISGFFGAVDIFFGQIFTFANLAVSQSRSKRNALKIIFAIKLLSFILTINDA